VREQVFDEGSLTRWWVEAVHDELQLGGLVGEAEAVAVVDIRKPNVAGRVHRQVVGSEKQ